MSTIKAILIGIRPPTLLLGISPVLLGTALGLRYLLDTNQTLGLRNLLLSLIAVAAVLLLQSAANLVNE